MKSTFVPRNIFCFALLAALPLGASAATVTVDDTVLEDTGVSYQKLSAAVAWTNANTPDPNAPHTIEVVKNITDNVQVIITAPVTITGKLGGVAQAKAAILVGVAGLAAAPNKCYIEIRTAGAVTISDLTLRPNSETGTAANQPDAIRMYEPTTVDTVGTYTLNRVWASGSDATAGNAFINPATNSVIWNPDHSATGVRKFSRDQTNANTILSAVFQTFDNGAGTIHVELNDCMAALGKSNALNLNAKGGTAKVKGGLYGHVARDGIKITGDGVTLTGSSTNRLRVVRSTCLSGSDAHAIEVDVAGTVELMEWVDVASLQTAQAIKGNGTGWIKKMQFCRSLGRFNEGTQNNAVVHVQGTSHFDEIRNCTFMGGNVAATTGRDPVYLHLSTQQQPTTSGTRPLCLLGKSFIAKPTTTHE